MQRKSFFHLTFIGCFGLIFLAYQGVSIGQIVTAPVPGQAVPPIIQAVQVQTPASQQANATTPIENAAPVVGECGCPQTGSNQPKAQCGCENCKCGQAKKPRACAKSHKALFYENDFSYLNKENNSDFCLGDRLKQIPIGCGSKLDIGGQFRYRYQSERGMGRQPGRLGFQNTQNDFGLTRIRLYANYKVNDRLRVYAEGIHADVIGANAQYVPRPIDINRGDLLNLFADVGVTENTTIRIGRQELLLGAQRLVSPLDWANTRRTFDGVRSTTKSGDMKFDMFYTQFVPIAASSFDNPDDEQDFYGAYATYTGLPDATVETYYLGYNHDTAGAPVSTAFTLNTFGTRVFGKTQNKLLYEFEGSYQVGEQNGLGADHEAFAVTGGIGYQFTSHRWKPTFWAFYDMASGNTPGGDFTRFNQQFPLAHKYLGFIDAVARSNIQSPNVRMTMSPTKRTNLLLWYHNFRADEASDIVPGVAVPSAQNVTSTDFGHELDFLLKYQMTPRSNLAVGYSHLWRGDKIIGTNDADFFYLQTTTNF